MIRMALTHAVRRGLARSIYAHRGGGVTVREDDRRDHRGMTGMTSRPAASGRGYALGAADSGMFLGGSGHGGGPP